MGEQIITSVNAVERPAALALFDRLGAGHTHEVFTVMGSHDRD